MKLTTSCTGIPLCLYKPLTRLLSYILLLTLFCTNTVAQAQQTISGTVINSRTDQPVIGATVKLKGASLATHTDEDGRFTLPSSMREGILEISHLGYQARQYLVKEMGKAIIIALEPEGHVLEEVVVSTGYQTIPKERATGSFVFIDSALLNRSVSTDIISRLKGVVPSLLFDERAGGEPKLSIRGRSTIFANADPLIVVDNFPYEGDIRNINPHDVESVSILRDAAAASIWGVRAGNGVIVITTKKGKANQPLQVSFNGNVTVGAKPDLWYEPRIASSDLVSLQQFLYDQKYYDSNMANTYSYPIVPPTVEVMADPLLSEEAKRKLLDGYSTNDLRDDLHRYFYRLGTDQQYSIGIRGGSDIHQYSFRAGYDMTQTTLVGNDNDRLTLSTSQTFKFTPRLSARSDIFFAHATKQANSTLSDLATTFPYQRLVDDNGNHLPIPRDFRTSFAASAVGKELLNWMYVPLDELQLANRQQNQQHLRFNQMLVYEFVPGLKAELYYQYERQFGRLEIHNNEKTYFTRNLINRFSVMKPDGIHYQLPMGDYLEQNWDDMDAHSGRFQLTYRYQKGEHDFSVLAGVEARQSLGNSNNLLRYGFEPSTGLAKAVNHDSLYVQYPLGNRATIPGSGGISATTDRFRSGYINGSYTLASRYIFSASARVDQSNLFGVKTNQRSAPLWSAGLKWDISGENYYPFDWLPSLQLRATYGFNGNIDNSATAYTTARYVNDFSTGLHYAYIIGLPNPELRFEKIATFNLGIDFALPRNMLYGNIEYYSKRAKDLLGYGPLEATVGATSYYGNLADMKASGIDIELNTARFGRAIRWSGTAFVSYITDRITKYEKRANSMGSYFNDLSLSGGARPIVGKPLYGIYSYPWAGLDPENGNPRGYLNGLPSTDYAGISRTYTLDSLRYHGRATPAWNAALRQTMQFKKWSMSFTVTSAFGYYFRRSSVRYSQLFNGINGHSDFALRWENPGDEAITHVPSLVYPASAIRDDFYTNASILVEKGDHIRLKDVRIDYRFIRIQLYAYASNLGILWRANNHQLDPAVATGVLPQPFRVSFGVNAHF